MAHSFHFQPWKRAKEPKETSAFHKVLFVFKKIKVFTIRQMSDILTWSDLDLLADLENAAEDGTAGHAAPKLLHLAPRLVHVEAADDDEPGLADKVPDGHGDLLHDVLAHNLNTRQG